MSKFKKIEKLEISLKEIRSVDYEFLYQLLTERKSTINISHKNTPTYGQHIKFIKSKPYLKWYIIIYDVEKVGTIYLTKSNEIGIFFKKSYIGKGIGKIALNLFYKKIPRSNYYANVNPKNIQSIRFFKSNGFKLKKLVFEYRKKSK